MSFIELFLLAVGLSMDAFAVSVCKGLAMKKADLKSMAVCGIWFGGFQALMPLAGFLLGSLFADIIEAADHAVVQNAVEIVLPRQVINLDRRPDFYIRHTQIPPIFILCFCVADSIATNRSIKELNSASVSFFASLTEKNGPMVSDHSCSLSRT